MSSLAIIGYVTSTILAIPAVGYSIVQLFQHWSNWKYCVETTKEEVFNECVVRKCGFAMDKDEMFVWTSICPSEGNIYERLFYWLLEKEGRCRFSLVREDFLYLQDKVEYNLDEYKYFCIRVEKNHPDDYQVLEWWLE